ncbi:MAG: A/G-specific adenine glycosylase [Actinomycetota bacterium]
MPSHALIEWAAANGRDLPWRHTRDPWAILVSEVMLQQTQVARVVPVWRAFLDRFPTPRACAAAEQADVVVAWHGMGYNRRAVHLHRCAVAIADDHDGAVPDDLDALLALPGIGPYTARAVLAFAFERRVGVLDVNAMRVHARLCGRAVDQRAADAGTPEAAPWAWNQAILDLGATVCTKRSPRCGDCPLMGECSWRGTGPDPAGAGARQSRFEGSDRQGRGRLVNALRAGPVSARPSDLAVTMGWPDDPERSLRVAMGVVADGLAKWEDESKTICLR